MHKKEVISLTSMRGLSVSRKDYDNYSTGPRGVFGRSTDEVDYVRVLPAYCVIHIVLCVDGSPEEFTAHISLESPMAHAACEHGTHL